MFLGGPRRYEYEMVEMTLVFLYVVLEGAALEQLREEEHVLVSNAVVTDCICFQRVSDQSTCVVVTRQSPAVTYRSLAAAAVQGGPHTQR